MDDYLAERFEGAKNGERVPFAQVRVGDGRAVGVTTYHTPRLWPGRPGEVCAVEIGGTWLAASAQRTGINPEAKFLLLEYAFETLRLARVDLKTDARNERSRRAIAGFGAKFEGVLRNWSPSHAPGEDGLLRDSAMFSVVAAEWPTVRATLRERLSARRL
jgi:RimJ/RimL family protein N-acetyltransferase